MMEGVLKCLQGAVCLYLLAVNLLAFAAFGLDKRRAVRGKWRIPERTLLLLAAFGGSIGALLGMRLFHHKTRKKKFAAGIPAILFLQIAAACAAVRIWTA